MKARVKRAFRHIETGRIWLKGELFEGDESSAASLMSQGFLEGGERAGANAARPPYESLTVRELQAICEEKGIEVPKYARKSALIAAIEAVG